MRILFFSECFGGYTTTFIYNAVTALAKKHVVKYVCVKRENADIFPFGDIEIVPYREDAFLKKTKWILEKSGFYLHYGNNKFSSRINEIIGKFKPDIIHCHFANEALKLIDNYNDKLQPIVITVHGYDVSAMLADYAYVKRLRDMVRRKNIGIIFSCQFFNKKLEDGNIRPVHSTVLRNSIYPEYFKRDTYAPAKGAFTFLQVSSFVDKKGHFYTVHAFKKFLDTYKPNLSCRLVFSGEGNNCESIKALVVQLGLSEKVEFVGWINPEKVKMLMEDANVFLHHSVTVKNNDQEGIPTSIIEAMAMELPVISTWHAGIPEIVKDGVNGYLVQERDIEYYAQRMNDVLAWGYLKESRQKVIDGFEINRHARQLEEYYYKMISA